MPYCKHCDAEHPETGEFYHYSKGKLKLSMCKPEKNKRQQIRRAKADRALKEPKDEVIIDNSMFGPFERACFRQKVAAGKSGVISIFHEV